MKKHTLGIDCDCMAQVDDNGEGHLDLCPLHGAAPELLEACKIALESLEKWGLDEFNDKDSPGTYQLRKAIAKANGK